MKQANIDAKLKDSELKISRATELDDRKYGVDAWFDNDIPIAIRHRPTTSINDYNGRTITIRREAATSRRRTYKCRGCGRKFQVDTLDPLPDYLKYCPICYCRDYASG